MIFFGEQFEIQQKSVDKEKIKNLSWHGG